MSLVLSEAIRHLFDPAPMDDTDRENTGLRAALVLLVAVCAFVAADLVLDREAGAEPVHVVLEGALMALSAGGAIWLWMTLRQTRMEKVTLERDIEAARAEATRWREEAREMLEGLGASMGRQFDRWELTTAEREVALLMLKGLSHKHAARVRNVSERTVRQQALAVYRKAGLAGRSELAAFFLEDLLVPPEAGEHAPHDFRSAASEG